MRLGNEKPGANREKPFSRLGSLPLPHFRATHPDFRQNGLDCREFPQQWPPKWPPRKAGFGASAGAIVERETGLEPATPSLGSSCSTS